mmetsp:Transcript_95923/g.311037  ORF Transcript_95923/g.311037 Transcript_95923/m.311037 type:complete len:114 (+) Transcript_95923:871-1212(+)
MNIGELFDFWTRGAWRATPHRVTGVSDQGRCSLAFFSNQSICCPEDGSPVSRTIPLLAASDDGEAWSGLRCRFGGEAGQSIEWPVFFQEALARIRSKGDTELSSAARLYAAGA